MLLTVSQFRQRVSLVRMPWNISCTHVGSGVVDGPPELDVDGAESGVLNDFFCDPALLAEPFPAALVEAALCVRSASMISLMWLMRKLRNSWASC